MSSAFHIVWKLGVLLLLTVSSTANAHEVRPAYLEINQTADHQFEVLWKQPSNGTLALHLEPEVSNGLINSKASQESAANSFVVKRWENLNFSRESFDGAVIEIKGLENTITDTLINISFSNGQQIQEILKPDSPRFEIHLTGTGNLPVLSYLTLGIEHILTGYDHLSFVLGLILLLNGRWQLIKTITAFTIAHSITLGIAALGFVAVSAPVIESLVALSIVFVAVEVVRFYQGDHGLTVKYPWLIAFTFGLLHGFAFAGSLAEIGLPQHNIPFALLLFNLGVETGQLIFVVSVITLIHALKKFPKQMPEWSYWLAPYGIGSFASFWMMQRLHFLMH